MKIPTEAPATTLHPMNNPNISFFIISPDIKDIKLIYSKTDMIWVKVELK